MTSLTRNTILAGCLAVLVMGCGDSTPDEPSTAAQGAGTSTSQSAERLVASVSSRPNIDGIPLDVYGDLIPSSGPANGPQRPGPEGPVDPAPQGGTPQPAEPEAGEKPAWSELIPAETIEGEMKAIRNKLAARLTSLGSYNSSYLEMRFSCATMALLAHIATQHDGEIGWKEKGKFIRVLAAEMIAVIDSSQARGKGGYTKTKESFLKICDLLDGNDPPELPEAEDEADFTEFAKLGFLMKRAEIAAAWMQTNVGSEDNFKEKSELARREASLLMLLSAVFNLEDYGYGPASADPEFSGYSDKMLEAAKAAVGAAKAGNFTEFDLQRSNIGQACAQCHMVFRNG